MNYGFVKVAAAIPEVKVGDCAHNVEKIIALLKRANEKRAQLVVFPELCLTAYTCGDLFRQDLLLSDVEKQLGKLLDESRSNQIVAIIGMPVRKGNRLFNCGVVIQAGRILGIIPKTYIPDCKGFGEYRWFTPAFMEDDGMHRICGQDVPFGTDIVFLDEGNSAICFGVELCEDLYTPLPPSSRQALAGATLLFNLSASNDLVANHEYRKSMAVQQSSRCIAAYVYSSCGPGESTTDLVFGGYAVIAEDGALLSESERFGAEGQLICSDIDVERLINDRMQSAGFKSIPSDKPGFRKISFEVDQYSPDRFDRYIDPYPFVPRDVNEREKRCNEIFNIQTLGLASRLKHTGIQKADIAVSGGLDSTLALLVTAAAFDRLGIDRNNIIAVTMPGFGTTDRTFRNAEKLIDAVRATKLVIDIREACLKHFQDIGHDPEVHDKTYENVQARERYQILMDIANKVNGLVIGTGDLSEIALGWSTYNGDHMSMYSVNCGVPKTLIRHLIRWSADKILGSEGKAIIESILETPITPELLPPDSDGNIKQYTEDIIGPYELHDFFLYHSVRYGATPGKILFLARQAFEGRYGYEEIKKWLTVFIKRFFSQQFKRSCMPDGPIVGSIGLSPRGGWVMASDVSAQAWLDELDKA
jgi:NAD+ synthase (glutamine-hydrolysing)